MKSSELFSSAGLCFPASVFTDVPNIWSRKTPQGVPTWAPGGPGGPAGRLALVCPPDRSGFPLSWLGSDGFGAETVKMSPRKVSGHRAHT